MRATLGATLRRHVLRVSALFGAILVLVGCPADPLQPVLVPTIAADPQSATVVSGDRATFSVTAIGTAPLGYQWQRNGTDIAGATSAQYGLPAALPADSGAVFRVMVSNAAGSVTSAAATLNVLVPPAITTQPASATVLSGATAIFTVAATGSGPLVYSWSRNGAGIAGFFTTSLGVANVALADSGAAFRVTVSNAASSVTSAAATLSVLEPPNITVGPFSQTVVSGANVILSVTATGSGPLHYQWQFRGVDMPGSTSANHAYPTDPSDSGGVLRVIVTNTAGADTSSGATLTVITPPAITAPPASLAVANGGAANFSVTATGSGPLSYQWVVNGFAVPGFPGAGPSLGMLVNPANDGALVHVIVSNAGGSVTSADATLTVLMPPVITADPVSRTAPSLTAVNFTVTAIGTAPLSYQWQANGSDMAGATSATLIVAAVPLISGTVFRAIVSNALGADTSAEATLTVADPPTITTQPADLTVVSGAAASFDVTATGTGPLSYQWQRNGADIGGATSASYAFTSAPADNGALFRVMVSNPAGSVTSSVATLTVLVAPTITVQPLSLTVAGGNNASFGVTATGSAPLAYQWRRNGLDIAGANAPIYNLLSAGSGDNGALFSVVVSNAAGSATSADATLTVTGPSLVTSAAVAAGSTHSLALKADGTVWAWGGDGSGQLGNGLPMSDRPDPVQVAGLTNIVQIAAGADHSLALRSDGTVWAWGQGSFSQLGNGGTANSASPVQVTGLTNVVRIAAGRRHSLAARSDGTVWAWGSNSNGQLGDGSNSESNVPLPVPIVLGTCVPVVPMVCPSGPEVQALAAGWIHSLVQMSDLFAHGWGDNFRGEIGSAVGASGSTSPIQISALHGSQILQLAAGNQYSLALLGDSTILRWGNAIGVGGSTPTPTALGTLSGIALLAAGYEHALALKSDGTVWGWGRNDVGQLTGPFSSYSNPRQVGFASGLMLTGVLRIGAGEIHTLVLKSDGTVWAFGDDHNCKLGRGCQGTTFSRDPVQVVGLKLF